MGKREIKKGEIIHNETELVGSAEILLSGSVNASNLNVAFTLSAGSIIGFLESPKTLYAMKYVAAEDCVVYEYPFEKMEDLEKIIISNAKIAPNLVAASLHSFAQISQNYSKLLKDSEEIYSFIKNSYVSYEELCASLNVSMQTLQSLEGIEAYTEDETVPDWKIKYFQTARTMAPEIRKAAFSAPYLAFGMIMDARDASLTCLGQMNLVNDYLYDVSSYVISSSAGDFFDLYSNLVFKASKNPFADTTKVEAAVSKLIIFMQDSKYVSKAVVDKRIAEYRERLQNIEDMLLSEDENAENYSKDACDAVENSLKQILDYAGYEENEAAEFTRFVEEYKALSDKNSTEDGPRKLRREISTHFYNVYAKIFEKTKDNAISQIPVLIKMFLYFGHVDEELSGLDNSTQLYEMARTLPVDPEGKVLTAYEWLLKIYHGEEEPSKNEFDLDYLGYLREERHSGNITAKEEEALKKDINNKVLFEIKNVFTLGNRITYGRITTFCPLFSEHNVLRPLDVMHLTPKKVYEIFDQIRAIDFNCFYRDVLYTNPKIGIPREYVAKEVLPYVILMPNVGNRGSLWQEISGVKRDTPGRMLMSILPSEDPTDTFIKLAGEFKWELCKRIQGVHWNDVTDPSLTAEYCDYLQFYRKNSELSSDAKEKIKVSIQKAKNNFRNVFVADYLLWIKYEGNGSPRLNRYVRNIMFRYCPFPAEVRAQVASNPLYSEILERYKTKSAQRGHTVNLIVQKLNKDGIPIPEEIANQIEFLKR